MCGIFFSISHGKALEPDPETLAALQARGPDAFHQLTIFFKTAAGDSVHLTFASSVLALRGHQIYAQPLVDSATSSIFCWNGEAWKHDGKSLSGNDSVAIFRELVSRTSDSSVTEALVSVLSKISGPFAFVYYHAPSQTVYYGRDRLGRRSLMVDRRDKLTLTLCSISSELTRNSEEVDTTALHSISFHSELCQQTHSWPITLPSINHKLPTKAISATPSPEAVKSLIHNLSDSLRLRVLEIPDRTSQIFDHPSAKVAILFSGGLDCTLLACLAHSILPVSEPIDLLNVAFENPRSLANLSSTTGPYEACPDRITGRSSFTSLTSSCPSRTWRFVAINIPYSLLLTHRPTITSLMRPHNTEMDLSIASALYFAARGIGEASLSTPSAHSNITPQGYSTSARILLSGLGADELFGGYARHSAAFKRGGYSGLVDELDLDITRIGQRNLGRDDRVMSHWGKEVRYPYLDEEFVGWALGLEVWEKCGFRAGKEVPRHDEVNENSVLESENALPADKMILRLAAWKLGMRGVAAEKKRAIQFGARTAKMELGKGRRKGTDVVEG